MTKYTDWTSLPCLALPLVALPFMAAGAALVPAGAYAAQTKPKPVIAGDPSAKAGEAASARASSQARTMSAPEKVSAARSASAAKQQAMSATGTGSGLGVGNWREPLAKDLQRALPPTCLR